MKLLFEPAKLGNMTLKNHIVMAPMTRSRAPSGVPNDLMAKYYSQRAGAGLIVTEGTSPSPNGLGYARIPGLFNGDHIAGWRKTTDAVHAKGGHIFIQLMHTGRVSHPLNLPAGTEILAPSAIQLSGQMYTDQQGMQDYPTPKEMSGADITKTKLEYVKSAEMSVQAGFDGVELHGANGYLIEQFLNPNVNKRTDSYGGSDENRMRFVLEIAEEIVSRIGGARLGIRISPYGVFNDTGAFPGIDQFYGKLSHKLSELGLVYIHVVDHSSMGAPIVSPEVKRLIRQNFKGQYILSGGYDAEKAEADLEKKIGDLVAFGRPFIANPDLVEKLKAHKSIRLPDEDKLYTPGPEGYTDWD